MKQEEYLEKQFAYWNIKLTDFQKEQFLMYYKILVDTNEKINLTTITNYKDVVNKHFLDSVALIKVLDTQEKIYTILDMGTGAGFPGIPLKIIFPEWNFTLVDSLNKRIKFLDTVIEKLNLNNIYTIHARAEDIGNNIQYREKFDLCISRAVANLATLSEYCIPFTKIDGLFISYKSGKIKEEIENAKRAINILGGEILNKKYFVLPETDIERCIIAIKKIKNTPKKYPRTSGKPSKEPINNK